MGYLTVDQNVEVDIYMDDIIDNINHFSDSELEDLKEEIEFKLSKTSSKNTILVASTLDEEYKVQILKEMFEKFSWAELDEIKKKIM